MSESQARPNVDRFNAFTDGVIVISMTLLVLNIELPDVNGIDDPTLAGKLLAMWPSYLGYVISFLVIAMYWLGYTQRFGDLKRIDDRFAWLNILFLLCIGFVPFATNLISEHSGFIATAVYSAVMMVIAALLAGMWLHANSAGLFEDKLTTAKAWEDSAPWLKLIAIFGLSIVVTWFQPDFGRLTYLLLFLKDDFFKPPVRH